MQQLRLELQQQKEATVAAEEEATKQSTASSSQVALTVYSMARLLELSFSNFLELSPPFTLTPGAQRTWKTLLGASAQRSVFLVLRVPRGN